ncbi:MAG TPA: hypothetical protein VH268_05240 [Solirubrobacterales bacterium]|nr:hypothetical protein [Solirubrobacterales bacterium]
MAAASCDGRRSLCPPRPSGSRPGPGRALAGHGLAERGGRAARVAARRALRLRPAASPFDVELMLSRMDAAGLDMAMVCSLAQRIETDFIEGMVAADPDRFFGLGQVLQQADGAIE